ncbi:LOW QUALITY PROTEIN: hypothetical protein HJC23_012698 [Cyclotella cryptica]|uniref:Guanylate cyclase domain-containing protein n=1 Tax=Cyclotella cryptica TaxID=29204 RepID=A0ABD3PLL1_9STRA
MHSLGRQPPVHPCTMQQQLPPKPSSIAAQDQDDIEATAPSNSSSNSNSSSPTPPAAASFDAAAPDDRNPRRRSQSSDRSSLENGVRRLSSILMRRDSAHIGGEGRESGAQSRKDFRFSFLMRGSITWEQLAERRSTGGRRASNLSTDNDFPLAEASNNGTPASRTASHGCFENTVHSTRSTVANCCHYLLRSTKKASRHPRSILLPTLVTFAILAAAGIIAVMHASHQHHKEKSFQLLDEARELAYELDDLLAKALLPLFTLKEMAGQFDEFRELQPEIVDRSNTTYVNDNGRTFRKVTDICTDPEVVDLYQRAAASIMKSSEMGNVLLNIQLQPDGTTMDHTQAIGLDGIHDKLQRQNVWESIGTGTVGTTGPLILVQSTSLLDGVDDTRHESLIFWAPIYNENYDVVTFDSEKRFDNFWGFSGVLLDWTEVLARVKLYEFFEERDMKFSLIEIVEGGDDKVVEASLGVEPPLSRDMAREAIQVQARNNWELLVDVPPPKIGEPAWAIWGSVLVLLGSFLVSLALMLFLVSKNDHEELLCRCIPRNIVRKLHAGETVIEKYDLATICFIDIVSFTTMSGSMKAHEVMEMLQILFREFDRLAEKYGVQNAETIGDAYITVSGGPEGKDATNGAASIAAFALDAVDVVKRLTFQDGKKIKIRVGVASGPVVAGVIGTANVPKFTLFGETTARAEEMEKTSLPLQIQCPEETVTLLECKRRREHSNENTWWIIRSCDSNGSYFSELEDVRPALLSTKDDVSTVNSTTLTPSDPRLSMESTGSNENEKYVVGEAGQNSPDTRRSSSSINASVIAEGSDSLKGNNEFENNILPEKNTEQKSDGRRSDSRLLRSLFNVKISFRSIGLMLRVAALNKRILLGTFLTFAILCGTGLAILYSFGHQYEEDKYKDSMDLADKADRWLEKEISKSLLPLFAMSELVKVVGKWNDLSFKIDAMQQYIQGNSVYKNVTGICDDPAYIDPFIGMASSIKQSSGMQKILINVQLAPSGVLCLTYPKNNTEDFLPEYTLIRAIGLDLFFTPSRAETSKAAVVKQGKTIQGPITLDQQGVVEALIARYPVFIDGNNITINGVSYPFWGLTIVLMDWEKLIAKFGIYNFFDKADMQFRMNRRDTLNEELVVIANSSDHEMLNNQNSIVVNLTAVDDDWTLEIGFPYGFRAPWLGWGTACIFIGSVFASSLVMMVLAITEMNKMLLYRMMPRKAIIAVKQGKTFVERDSDATILFAQVLGFEKLSGEMNSKDFLLMLTQLYSEFDKLALKYQCTKIETIGAYYIVKGPGPDLCNHGEREGVTRIALFALHAMDFVRNYQYKGVQLQIRVGFATGPVVAGVIGSGGLPKYTVFGDTVNFSSRMESTSRPMKIQCPHHTYDLLMNSAEFIFDLEKREEEGELGVYVKGKGKR